MPVRSLSLAVIAGLSLHAVVQAQTPAGYSQVATGTVPAIQQPAGNYERVSGRNNPALSFYGGSAALAYSAQPPRPLPPPRPMNVVPTGKPFSGVQQASAISPYLGLDAGRETESSLPNYFLYVKPQLDQQRVNQIQHAEYRKLQQQVRTATTPGAAATSAGGIPITGHSSQFMNNGGYYPTLRR
jgi:hypothetical protein